MTITSVENQITQRILRGEVPDTSDTLLYSPTQIVRVGLKADTDDYIKDIDYIISGNVINWAPLTPSKEPVPGQAYYVTYKYNPTQFLKDFDTVTNELRTDFNTLLPNLDITKSVARDLFVNVMSRQFSDAYNTARHIYLIQSLQNVDELTDAELDAIGVNYSKPRLPITKSGGKAKFYMNIARGYDVTIPVGLRIATQPSLTNGQQISFLTTESKTITAGQTYVYVSIEADSSGISGNVGAETVKLLVDTLDVDGVINIVATSGGQDQETNEDYAKRLISVFKSRNVASVDGIRELVLAQPNVIDCYIADVGNPVMVRDNGLGGKVDIYIQSESGFTGTILDEEYVYGGTDHLFLNQPSIAIVSVLNVTTSIDITSSCSIVKDTGLLKESTRSSDKLHITAGAVSGNTIHVSYTYNKLFNDTQTLLDSDSYHIAGIDDLVRSAEQSLIDITGAVKIQTGYVFNDIRVSIINQLTTYIEAKEIGSSIVYGDIINIIHDTPGVIDLTPLSRLSRQSENTNTTINLRGNEYPRAGIITINQIL